MANAPVCESCGMPMEAIEDHAPNNPTSAWCRYCTTPEGSLQPFEERFERMSQWMMRKEGMERQAAETATRDYLRNMPAWKNHPALQ